MPVVGVTAGGCAAAWSSMRRQVGITKSQNQLKTQYALGGLHQRQLKVATVVRVCGGVSLYPFRCPPSSPPPRPEARVAVAGGNVCGKQLCLQQCSITVSLARPPGKVPLSLAVVPSFVGSSSQPAKKHLRYTSRESPQGKQQRGRQHTLPHPFIKHLPVPSINYSPD